MPGFRDLINEHKHRRDLPEAMEAEPLTPPEPLPLTPSPPAPPKNVRPRGKSADPGYAKVTLYLANDTLTEAKIQALKDGRDLSDIAEELFRKWLHR